MPVNPTPAQSEASRLNALRSTGPVTLDGKAASSRNAVRHGLRGAVIEVLPEERNFLVEVTASLESRWKPADAVEYGLVQTLALLELKLVCLDSIEMQVLAAAIAEPDGRRLPEESPIDEARTAIGQDKLTVSPLQMALVAAGIGNDGVVPEPTLIERVTTATSSGGSQPCSARSLRPETWVRPVIHRVKPMVMPRRMNRPPSVTMNDGRPVRTTIMPLM